MDASSPTALGEFWCVALGYVTEPPPEGFETWEAALEAFGVDPADSDRAYAIVDPAGVGPRLFFQRVPEGKSAKNRVHLDINVGKDALQSRAGELVSVGARVVKEFDGAEGRWITMLDPEGNEFCLQ